MIVAHPINRHLKRAFIIGLEWPTKYFTKEWYIRAVNLVDTFDTGTRSLLKKCRRKYSA